MRIRYLNGTRLYHAFLAGGEALVRGRNILNSINVFPIADGDTGTNLAATVMAIRATSSPRRSIKETSRSIADAALEGARGNSGIIFAQFIQGFSVGIGNTEVVCPTIFADSIRQGVEYAYKAINKPVEGTMLTVMREWSERFRHLLSQTTDFYDLLRESLHAARKSLDDTPQKLEVLARAGVVDAGAKGFVDFLEGILLFIMNGRIQDILHEKPIEIESMPHTHMSPSEIMHRYCAEALVKGDSINLEHLKERLGVFGNSVIVAGTDTRAHIHLHTSVPADAFAAVHEYGCIINQKVDDMKMQSAVNNERVSSIALVSDSACDLPLEILDKYQIHIVPIGLSFGETTYLDKITVTPEHFYRILEHSKYFPKSSQPNEKTFERLYSYLFDYYDSIIAIHLSSALSGTYHSSLRAAARFSDSKITVIDSCHLSGSLGLIMLRIAENIVEKRYERERVISLIDGWIARTKIIVEIESLEFLMRGGRLSPMKGFLAHMLHLKPVISVNDKGKTIILDTSFSREKSMQKSMAIIKKTLNESRIWKYAVLHANAPEAAAWYEQGMLDLTGQKPEFTINISPVIALHAGAGAAGVAFMYE